MALANQFDLIKGQTLYLNNDLLDPIRKCILFDHGYNTHKDIGLSIMSRYEKTVAKPKPLSYPHEPRTLGEHIKRQRIDRGMSQATVARILGVSEDCVCYWE